MLFLFQDPLGDAHGLAYLYPQAALYREAGEGYADLTALAGEVREGELVLKLRLARYPNPLGGPLGFSLATALVYLDLAPGGEEALLPGLRTPRARGGRRPSWSRASGWSGKAPRGRGRRWGPGGRGSGWSGPQAFPRGSTATTGRWGSLTPSPPGTCAPFPRKGGLGPGGPLGHAPSGGRPRPPPRGPKGRLPGGVLRPLRPKRFALEAPSLAAFGLGALSLVLAFLLGRKGR